MILSGIYLKATTVTIVPTNMKSTGRAMEVTVENDLKVLMDFLLKMAWNWAEKL